MQVSNPLELSKSEVSEVRAVGGLAEKSVHRIFLPVANQLLLRSSDELPALLIY
jgi:hypothetical protein